MNMPKFPAAGAWKVFSRRDDHIINTVFVKFLIGYLDFHETKTNSFLNFVRANLFSDFSAGFRNLKDLRFSCKTFFYFIYQTA